MGLMWDSFNLGRRAGFKRVRFWRRKALETWSMRVLAGEEDEEKGE